LALPHTDWKAHSTRADHQAGMCGQERQVNENRGEGRKEKIERDKRGGQEG